ncbi:putative Holliday junction resolvase YggF [Vibrio sp. JCM 18905]|nr:putative Holliday junction resolvase YggF [Vibrio sp. JCM 18905]
MEPKALVALLAKKLLVRLPPLKAFKANDGIPNWDDIEKQIKEWQPDLLVVGLPTDLHGKDLETITPPRARKFAKRLQGRYGLPVELHDERLSTAEARAELFSMGGYKALSKGNVDCQSAVVILESWFEALWG